MVLIVSVLSRSINSNYLIINNLINPPYCQKNISVTHRGKQITNSHI